MSEQNFPAQVPVGQPPYQPPARPPRRGGPGVTWPLILIMVGVVLLLNTTGALPWSAWSRLWMLWPGILILIGLDVLLSRYAYLLRVVVGLLAVACLIAAGVYLVWTMPPVEAGPGTVQGSWALQGAERGQVRIEMGVGRLDVHSLDNTANFAELRADGEDWSLPRTEFRNESGEAWLRVYPTGQGPHWGWFGGWRRESYWHLYLAPRVTLQIDIDAGVSQTDLDLSGLDVEDLTLDAGVGEIRMTLPAQVREGRVSIRGGVGAVHVTIPQGLAARIRVDGGLGRVDVDTGRFPKSAGVYRSGDYDSAAYRLDITIQGGVGTVTVR